MSGRDTPPEWLGRKRDGFKARPEPWAKDLEAEIAKLEQQSRLNQIDFIVVSSGIDKAPYYAIHLTNGQKVRSRVSRRA